MIEYNALDIEKYFVESGVFLNHKKLQKMVYYAYSWYLVKNNTSVNNIKNRLFENRTDNMFFRAVQELLESKKIYLKSYKNHQREQICH